MVKTDSETYRRGMRRALHDIASHAIAEEIERRVEGEFGKGTATIHVGPLP